MYKAKRLEGDNVRLSLLPVGGTRRPRNLGILDLPW